MAEWPYLVTDRKWCGALAAPMASMATLMVPSVPFLKPTGQETGGQLAVHLGFGGTGTDGAPAHQIRHVLRGDHVEEFGGGRQPHVVEIQQQLATDAQAVVDLAAVVEVGSLISPFQPTVVRGFSK